MSALMAIRGKGRGVRLRALQPIAPIEPVPPVEPVEPPPAPSERRLLFASSWDHARGTETESILDGNRWSMLWGSGVPAAVVDGAPLGWTETPNVLQLRDLGTAVANLQATNVIPEATSHFGRFYFRNDETMGRQNHVVTYWPVGRIELALWNRVGYADGVNLRMRMYYQADGTSTEGTGIGQWILAAGGRERLLPHRTWFRYEWHKEYLTPRTYRIWPRVYERQGTLPLFDARDYFGNEYRLSLAEFYAAGGAFGIADPVHARTFGMGQEGARTPASGEAWYHAAVALATGGWIGGL
jgi:hypothetical protein